jgi:hypothetical protein
VCDKVFLEDKENATAEDARYSNVAKDFPSVSVHSCHQAFLVFVGTLKACCEFLRKLLAWRLRTAARVIRRAVVGSMNEFIDDMLGRLENRMNRYALGSHLFVLRIHVGVFRVEKSLELTDPTLAAQAVKDRIIAFAERQSSPATGRGQSKVNRQPNTLQDSAVD